MAIKKLKDLTEDEWNNLAYKNQYLKDAAYNNLVRQAEDDIVYNVLPPLKTWLLDWEFGASCPCRLKLKSEAYECPHAFMSSLNEINTNCITIPYMDTHIKIFKDNLNDADDDNPLVRVWVDTAVQLLIKAFEDWYADADNEDTQASYIKEFILEEPMYFDITAEDIDLVLVNTEDNTISWDEVKHHTHV